MSTQMQSTAQRAMIMVLPVVFIPFILSFPSGLMIYWLTTNLWTTGQGIVTRRLMPRPAPPPKRSSRTAPKEADETEDASPATSASTTTTGGTRSGAPRRVKKKRGGRSRR
jgi:YidC/Oxa1 family membrane protein insertase